MERGIGGALDSHLWSQACWEQAFQLVWPTDTLSNFKTAIISSRKEKRERTETVNDMLMGGK